MLNAGNLRQRAKDALAGEIGRVSDPRISLELAWRLIEDARRPRQAKKRQYRKNEGCPRFFSLINAPLEVCEASDSKGFYRRARSDDLKDFTGVSAPYEPPSAAELEVNSGEKTVEACLADLLAFVERRLALK